MLVEIVSLRAIATPLFTGLWGDGLVFDPHRPHQFSHSLHRTWLNREAAKDITKKPSRIGKRVIFARRADGKVTICHDLLQQFTIGDLNLREGKFLLFDLVE